MDKAKKRPNARAGITQISITLPKSLLPEVDKLAAADNRNRSNYISNLIWREVERVRAESSQDK